MAVVATRELEDAVASGERPCKARRAHGRLGPGRHQADLFHRGDRIDDLRSKLDLGLRRRPKARPALGGVTHGGDCLQIGVTEDQRAPGHDPVEVAIAVDVLEIRALAAADE